jgi:hypothetical protein
MYHHTIQRVCLVPGPESNGEKVKDKAGGTKQGRGDGISFYLMMLAPRTKQVTEAALYLSSNQAVFARPEEAERKGGKEFVTDGTSLSYSSAAV